MISARNRRFWLRSSALLCLLAFLAGAALVFVAASSAPPALAQQSDRAKALGRKVKCVCGGCDDTASTCNHNGGAFSGPCDTAKAMLKEIDQRISRGESDDLILQDFVQEYGPTVLIEPPKRGFNWVAWIMPIVLPILAFVMVWSLVRRWRQRAALAPAGGPGVSPDLLARVQRAEEESDE